MADTRLKNRMYRIWAGIKTRCDNRNFPAYSRYGGRGVAYDSRWQSFDGFVSDMGKAYHASVKKNGEMDTTIERIDNGGNYCKENCRWATRTEQARNTRQNRLFNGKTLAEWSEELGVKRSTLAQRIYVYGWSVDKALST